MHLINARNVHHALPKGLRLLKEGIQDTSRSGDVVVWPTPVTTIYERPWERMCFWELRDANPFFHIAESLWMIAGRNDVEWISYFNSGFARFSDDGKTYHGAYGYRWRKHFAHIERGEFWGRDIDQIKIVIELLKAKPRTRRAIIQMWDCTVDLHPDEYPHMRDLPCNDIIAVWLDKDDRLCMTVFCRSNDIIWGLYGSNSVHFSVLQEYIAQHLREYDICRGMGPLYLISNNFHAYTELFQKHLPLADEGPDFDWPWMCPYVGGKVRWTPIVADAAHFDEELKFFFAITEGNGVSPPSWYNGFFPQVALPMWHVYRAFKEKRYDVALNRLEVALREYPTGDADKQSDVLTACIAWMQRREANARMKNG